MKVRWAAGGERGLKYGKGGARAPSSILRSDGESSNLLRDGNLGVFSRHFCKVNSTVRRSLITWMWPWERRCGNDGEHHLSVSSMEVPKLLSHSRYLIGLRTRSGASHEQFGAEHKQDICAVLKIACLPCSVCVREAAEDGIVSLVSSVRLLSWSRRVDCGAQCNATSAVLCLPGSLRD